MEILKNIFNYVKNHSWDYVDAAFGSIIVLLLLILTIG